MVIPDAWPSVVAALLAEHSLHILPKMPKSMDLIPNYEGPELSETTGCINKPKPSDYSRQERWFN